MTYNDTELQKTYDILVQLEGLHQEAYKDSKGLITIPRSHRPRWECI